MAAIVEGVLVWGDALAVQNYDYRVTVCTLREAYSLCRGPTVKTACSIIQRLSSRDGHTVNGFSQTGRDEQRLQRGMIEDGRVHVP